jgi:hypothetical protein
MPVSNKDRYVIINTLHQYIIHISNPSSRTTGLATILPITEMNTRNLPGGKEQPARKADNFTAICEPVV